MPEVVDDAVEPTEGLPVLGSESAQREPVEEAAPREQDNEQDREEESRDRVADDDRGARPYVEGGAVTHRLGDAERYRDQVHEERRPQAERDRHVHLVDDEPDDGPVAEIALPEIEAEIVPDHREETLDRGAVESVHPLDLAHEFGIEPARSPVPPGEVSTGARDQFPAAGAGDARGDVDAGPDAGFADLREKLFHRAAGRHVNDDEVENHDPEQGRDHEQHPAQDVGGHRIRTAVRYRPSSGAGSRVRRPAAAGHRRSACSPRHACTRSAFASSNHQVSKPSP